MLTIERSRLESLFEAGPARAAIAQGLISLAEGRAVTQPIGLTFPAHNGECHIKAGSITGFSRFVVKVANGFYDNPRRGLPSSDGLLMLFSSETGSPLALLLDHGYITDRRTALTGAMASRLLARSDCKTIGIIGTGIQARLQLFDHADDWPNVRFVIWGRNLQTAAALASIAGAAGIRAHIEEDLQSLCRQADIIVTTTPANAPLIDADWISDGTHVTAVGADSPDKQELPVALLARAALIVADERANALRNGECRAAIQAGVINPADIVELGLLLARGPPARSAGDVTIADLTGVAVQDLALASLLFDRSSS